MSTWHWPTCTRRDGLCVNGVGSTATATSTSICHNKGPNVRLELGSVATLKGCQLDGSTGSGGIYSGGNE